MKVAIILALLAVSAFGLLLFSLSLFFSKFL
jgi:hypothetical protein